MRPFWLGVNYWPIGRAMAMWKDLDRVVIAEDFALIAEAGFDCVRVFLLWEDFQPGPEEVSADALDGLAAVADAADAADLGLMPTLFTGHMSGANWVPAWALDRTAPPPRFRTVSGGRVVGAGIRNWYADAALCRAQTLLATEVAVALAGHPALRAWDLGNEPSNCVLPPTAEHAVSWLARMGETLHGEGSGPPITIGLHQEDLEGDRIMGPRETAGALDFACMHAYPAYARWARHPEDDGVPLFLGLLTRWLSGQEVLLAEFGAPTKRSDLPDVEVAGLLGEEEAARYTERVLRGLHGHGFLGALLWCFGDYDLTLRSQPPFDLAPHEMSFGLWRADRSPKPVVSVVKTFGRREKVEPPRDRPGWITMTREEYLADPARHVSRLYGSFVEEWQDS